YSNNWPFVGQKMDLLEGGLRVPLIARWPARIAPGSQSEAPVITMDWMATFLDAAKVAADPNFPLDGTNLLPMFDDPAWHPDRALYWRMKHRGQCAITRGDWKWLCVDQNEYLFNIRDDPRERANLRERDPQRFQSLREDWRRWNETMPAIPPDAKASLPFDERDLPRATF
ncbi:MAG: sulfatase-like hydrolase/transferase, partial [Burkholderiales bacterium]|nr:sulfatase-like hydrolase/transferase [Burkholderiales bacterium]